MSDLYKIEKCEHKGGFQNTRWAAIAEAIKPGEAVLLANRNEAAGLKYALKRRGKLYRHESQGNGGAVKIYCVGMMENCVKN